ncbi:MAG TPA: C40 family peptidase [Gaiellaceae bacterium]|nr:C40 family peptidase [Gaiellaceae bacterium]
MRAEPDDGAEQVTQALAGEPLAVEAGDGGWSRIRTAYGYPGWIREDALGGEPDGEWPGLPLPGDPVAKARAYLGTPYEWGGMTNRGIDCSGLVHMAYRGLGRLVPRDAHEQEAAAEALQGQDSRAGDLVFFGPRERAHHVAFWLGGGRILHATSREGVQAVVEEPLENVPREHELRAARL